MLGDKGGPECDESAQDEDNRAVPERKPKPDEQRAFPLAEKLARHVVNGRDMIGIHGMPQTERESK